MTTLKKLLKQIEDVFLNNQLYHDDPGMPNQPMSVYLATCHVVEKITDLRQLSKLLQEVALSNVPTPPHVIEVNESTWAGIYQQLLKETIENVLLQKPNLKKLDKQRGDIG